MRNSAEEDASNLLGEPIERTDIMDAACLYYGPPGLAVKLGAQDTSDMMAKAKAGRTQNGGDMADTVTKMLGAVAANPGKGSPGRGTSASDLPRRSRRPPANDRRCRYERIFGGIGADSKGGGLGADIPTWGTAPFVSALSA